MDNQSSLFHIVVVDDEQEICEVLQEFLSMHSFQVTVYSDSEEAFNHLEKDKPDLLITDYMMPKLNGLCLAAKVKEKINIPIIMFTAVDDCDEKISALETAVDDYLIKPFNLRILLARVKALLRRFEFNKKSSNQPSIIEGDCAIFSFDEMVLDTRKRELVRNNGETLSLSAIEFDILEVLVRFPQQILSREDILNKIDKVSFGVDDRRVDVHISRLRQKLESVVLTENIIKTVRNRGYLFSAEVIGKAK